MLQLFLSDTKTFFSKEYGWPAGMGDRNGRWAMIFDDGKVIYAENESPGEVSVIPNQLSYSGNNPFLVHMLTSLTLGFRS